MNASVDIRGVELRTERMIIRPRRESDFWSASSGIGMKESLDYKPLRVICFCWSILW